MSSAGRDCKWRLRVGENSRRPGEKGRQVVAKADDRPILFGCALWLLVPARRRRARERCHVRSGRAVPVGSSSLRDARATAARRALFVRFGPLSSILAAHALASVGTSRLAPSASPALFMFEFSRLDLVDDARRNFPADQLDDRRYRVAVLG